MLSKHKNQYINLKEVDLEAYFGKNAQSYINYWKHLTTPKTAQTRPNFRDYGHFPAFFLGFIWFFL
jgi:hypothetical protein